MRRCKKIAVLFFCALFFVFFVVVPVRATAPKPKICAEQENSFGESESPNWLNVSVTENADFVVVDNGDGFVFRFHKGNAGYNEIWQNGTQIVADERWTLEYLGSGAKYKQRGTPQYVTWSQPASYHVVVKRFFRDYGSPETTFNITYIFHGGFRVKIRLEAYIGVPDKYRVQWTASGINKTHVKSDQYCVMFWDEGEKPIVFDYADVSERFGNITQTQTEPWANGHKLTEFFDIGDLTVGSFTLDPSFGHSGIYTSSWETDDWNDMFLCKFLFDTASGSNGTGVSMYAFVATTYGSTIEATMYIYTDDSGPSTKIGETYQTTVPNPPAEWRTATFEQTPTFVDNTYYWLGVKFSPNFFPDKCAVYYTAGDSQQSCLWHVSKTMYDRKIRIYCTYNEVNHAPTNDALSLDLSNATYKGAKTLLTAKQDYKFVYNCSDQDGVTYISYAEIRLDCTSKNIILRATRGSGDTWAFSEQSDPSDYVTLNATASSHSTSGTQKTFSFLVTINWGFGDATETIGVRCYVIDSLSASDQDDYANVFGVEDDLIVASASVIPTEVAPDTNVVFSGVLYYENTTTPPYDPPAGITVYLELDGLLQGYTSTVLPNGTWTKTMRSPSNTGNKTYIVYAMTDEISVANQTVYLFVMSSGPTGGGGTLPTQPTYRPENYTWTPPIYAPPPEEVVVTGLQSVGLNVLIVAIVGTTGVALIASMVKPQRITLASKTRVRKATNKDYRKRMRRPKRKVRR